MNEILAELITELAIGDYAGIRNEYRTRFYAAILDFLANGGHKTRKKNEAKKRAKFIFSTMNPAPATIQEFLVIALSTPK
jgi:hypothetical protein